MFEKCKDSKSVCWIVKKWIEKCWMFLKSVIMHWKVYIEEMFEENVNVHSTEMRWHHWTGVEVK